MIEYDIEKISEQIEEESHFINDIQNSLSGARLVPK